MLPCNGLIGIILPSLSKNSDSFEAWRIISGALLVPFRFARDFDSSGSPIITMSASETLSTLER